MKILAIETSCDETAVAIVEGTEVENGTSFRVLGNALLSQIDVHQEYGGVFPMLAKREHAKNLIPLLEAALEEAELVHENDQVIPEETQTVIGSLLEREGELAASLLEFVKELEPPQIDAVAVTAGPGLEPALWVGVNFAKALSLLWDKPLIAANHMEGHLFAALLQESAERTYLLPNLPRPLLGLLISGGHTEIVEMRDWLSYKLIGQTRDDAVGEAFDKVARMMGLPYPGGPEISLLAEEAREQYGPEDAYTLPRPMLTSGDSDFSFSGLKTAVLYMLKKFESFGDEERKQLAKTFENAVADVLYAKTLKAIDDTGAKALAIGGGVSANAFIKRTFRERLQDDRPDVLLSIPPTNLTGDNAIMIALAGYYHSLIKNYADPGTLKANGNLSLAQ